MKANWVLVILILVAGGVFIWSRFFREDFKLPQGGETKVESVGVVENDKDGEIVEKKIMVTDGVKHSVPLNEIISGGPGKDGIPSIDRPKFVSVTEAKKWLPDDNPGVAFSRGSAHRFYPYRILVWHEIVNDVVSGERVLVTYCPLCLTGFVFDPLVKGERVEFGTSGSLWKSNLVMYDRKTESLWPQILGEAVVGEMTGTKLKLLPSDQLRFGEWKRSHPDGEVLSQETGTMRSYGYNPYGDYYAVTGFSLDLTNFSDRRLAPNAFVFGLASGEKAKAWSVEAVKKAGEAEDAFAGETFLLRYEKELDVIRMYKKFPDGKLERINPFSAFWFSWAATHPETELFK